LEKKTWHFTTLYCLVSLIVLLTNNLEIFISVNKFNYSTLGRSSPRKVTTGHKKQLSMSFFRQNTPLVPMPFSV